MAIKIREWHWEITRKCNLRCKHCISDCGISFLKELEAYEAVNAVKFMKYLGCQRIMITGGEPLCYGGFWAVLKECKRQQIAVHFLTNGILITPNLVQRLIGCVERVGVSLDGFTEKMNDCIRGKKSFKRIIQAIKLLVGYFPVSVFFTASSFNLGELEGAINLSRSLGAEYIHVSEITIAGRAMNNCEMFELSKGQKSYLRRMAADMTDMHKPIERCNVDLSTLYLASNGLVYPCVEISLRLPCFNLGNIKNPEFKKNILTARHWFAGSNNARCCYQIFAGNDLVFCLNGRERCFLLERRKDDRRA